MRALFRTPALVTLLAVGFATPAAGCHDATSPGNPVPGAYTLRSVGGQPLPVVVSQDASGTIAIVSDAITLQSDGTLTEQETLRATPVGGGSPTIQSTSHTGTWTLSGSDTVAARLNDGTHLSGAFTGGNTITIAATTTGGGNATLVYQK